MRIAPYYYYYVLGDFGKNLQFDENDEAKEGEVIIVKDDHSHTITVKAEDSKKNQKGIADLWKSKDS